MEPNNEGALAAGIARLLDDPEARRRMGEIGRHRVRTALAWSYSEPPLLAAYEHAFALRAARALPAAGTRGGGASA